MTQRTRITLARGDGIGPEIMAATLKILDAAGARLDYDEIEIGESAYLRGAATGIEPSAWDALKRNSVLLKAPITTPQGSGFKSLNVTMRKAFGLYSNVRPCVSYHPVVKTKHPKMDVVIVRENEEDLYAGIEYRLTDDVYQCLKLITRPGCERVCRYAFEYARVNHRSKVTAFVKDNIMKMTDGIFHQVFKEVAAEYPEIESDSMIVDIGAARLADTPQMFDVIVTLNLYGDIISDIAAQVAGSVGLAGSANIGDNYAMFEAIHGSAPTIAGKGIANPSGLLQAAVMMLVHVGQADIAETIQNAWLRTIEDGVHTPDIFDRTISVRRAGTMDFADAVISRLGKRPQTLPAVTFGGEEPRNISGIRVTYPAPAQRALVGVDVFYSAPHTDEPTDWAAKLQPLGGEDFTLKLISNRGQMVWPDSSAVTMRADQWRARYFAKGAASRHAIVGLLDRIDSAGIDFIKTEHLFNFDGKPAYTGPSAGG